MVHKDNIDVISFSDILEIAKIVWAIEKYSQKIIVENNIENKCRPLNSNILKLKKILQEKGINIIDYTGQKYNEGMNVDVLDTVKSDILCPMVKETIEPTITYNGEIMKRARIIKEIGEENNG